MGFFNNYNNADEVLKKIFFTIRRPDLEEYERCRSLNLFKNIN